MNNIRLSNITLNISVSKEQNTYFHQASSNNIDIQDSSSSECQPNYGTTSISNCSTSTQIQNDPKMQKKQAILKRFQQVEDQSRREQEQIRKNPVVKRTSVQDRIEYDQLKKQFQSYKYLPLQSLREVKKDIQQFSKYCKQQSLSPQQLIVSSIRFEQKKKLFRSVRLAVEQVRSKVKQQERDAFEKQLLISSNIQIYSKYIAERIQKIFFKELYHKAAQKKKGEAYFKQIKIVLKEFSDKNNLDFRRRVLNPNYNYKQLTTITEDEIKCLKTKEEEIQRVRQLVRQNQKIDIKAIDQDQEILQFPKLSPLNSISDIYNTQKDPSVNQNKKQNCKALQKTKQICKKTYLRVLKSVKNMSQRVLKIRNMTSYSSFLKNLEIMNLDINQ